ncbi:MAG TPA: serine/threonine protein phosphatase [Cyanobacteria bacterium UBA8543]|nr:serine/threonine protein phosphatase [Cyanobacteria bacterium UBA8543]
METRAATLHCSNIRCQAPNPQSNKFCQQCRTPLLRRYLWAMGSAIDAYKPGEVLAGRYELVQPRILLDTQPGLPPETPLEIPRVLAPYLRLSPYGLHLPQVYGRLTLTEERRRSEVWLLEDAPISTGASLSGKEAASAEGYLLPELTSVWKNATAVRQLNWLWQMASLWQPLSSEGVASSLLAPTLLRVEGSIVRLLELQLDTKGAPTLQELGQFWLQRLVGASSVINEFFQQLCTQLTEGQIQTSEELVALLDRALKECGRSQSHTYQIFTRTDSGPSRPHNEDACYPPSGQLIRPSTEADTLAIVCDGIGGHEGGEVASHLAIDTLRERVEKLHSDPERWNSQSLTLELEKAVCTANDSISSTNDNEHRSERQRMGTTLVMAQACAHEIYITHVGDSRVYWITRYNCHQVTQDDDLASREVRLGYSLYRNAVQQPTSGSLVQALGMAPSSTLHPTVQRFVVDEDCVFLLCSDGLSDHDRVEQYWKTEILPIIEGRVDLPTAGARLIELANTQNGHDNTTVALVYCKVASSKQTKQTQLPPPHLESLPTAASMVQTTLAAAPSAMKTQQLSSPGSNRRPWGLLLGILVLLGLGGVLAYVFIPRELVDPLMKQIGFNSSSSPTSPPATSSPLPASPTPNSSEVPALDASALIQVTSSTTKNSQDKAVPLLLRRGLPPQNPSVVGIIPAGSVLQVISKSPDAQQENWLQLRVCSPGSGNSKTQQPASGKISAERLPSKVIKSPIASNSKPTPVAHRQVAAGEGGWIREAEIVPIINLNFTPTPAQQSECAPVAPAPASTPIPKPTSSG